MRNVVAALIVLALWSSPAAAQSTCQYIAPGAVLTAAQWNQCFAGKQNFLGFTPINPANLVGLSPIVVGPSGGNTQISINLDSNFATSGGNLALAAIPSGDVLGNPTAASAEPIPMAARIKLTANTTFYVNANAGGTAVCGLNTGVTSLTCNAGSDSTTAVASTVVSSNVVTAPFNTLLVALKSIQSQIDWNGFRPTINMAHGSSTNYGGATCAEPIGTNGSIFIQGDDAAVGNVTMVAPNNNFALYVTHYCIVRLRSVTIADQGSALFGLETDNFGGIDVQNVAFTTFNNSSTMFFVGQTGHMELEQPVSPATDDVFIQGGGGTFLKVAYNGIANFGESDGLGNATYTINVSPGVTFATALIQTSGAGANLYNMSSGTFTGSTPTGVKAIFAGQGHMFNGGTACNTAIPGTGNCQLTQGFQDDANDSVNFPGNVGFGTATNPLATVTISKNAATGLCTSVPLLCLSSVDGTNPTMIFLAATNTTGNQTQNGGTEIFQTSNGTAGSPSAIGSGSIIGQTGWSAYNGSSFPTPRSRIIGITTEVQSGTNQGTGIEFDTTTAGGAVRAAAMTLMAGLYVGTKTFNTGTAPPTVAAGNLFLDGNVTLASAAATAASGQVSLGSTTNAAGASTCPTGTVGGQTVAGCMIINVAGTSRNVPFF